MSKIGDEIVKGAIKFSEDFRNANQYNAHVAGYFSIGGRAAELEVILKEIEEKNIEIDAEYKKYLKDKSIEYYAKTLAIFDKFLSDDSYLRKLHEDD